MIHHDSYLALRFSGCRGMSLLLFENAVLPSSSDSSRLVKRHGQEPNLNLGGRLKIFAAGEYELTRRFISGTSHFSFTASSFSLQVCWSALSRAEPHFSDFCYCILTHCFVSVLLDNAMEGDPWIPISWTAWYWAFSCLVIAPWKRVQGPARDTYQFCIHRLPAVLIDSWIPRRQFCRISRLTD